MASCALQLAASLSSVKETAAATVTSRQTDLYAPAWQCVRLRALTQMYDEALEPVGVSIGQYSLLADATPLKNWRLIFRWTGSL